MKRPRRNLREIEGGCKGGLPRTLCANEDGFGAAYRVACRGDDKVVRIWMLCASCADIMIKQVPGAIAHPANT